MQARLFRGFAALALTALAFTAAPKSASAQGTKFGVAASWASDYDLGVGVFAKFHLTELNHKPVAGRANFDYFFVDTGCNGCADFHFWSASMDGLYDLTPSGSLHPYVGAGLGFGHWSYGNNYCNQFGIDCSASDTEFGPQALIGLNLKGKLQPFVEAKYEFRSGGQFVLRGGILF